MAHVLRITDGTTTVTFTSGNQYLSRYVPDTSFSGEDLKEVATVGFIGASVAAAVTTIQSVSALLEQARRWDKYKTGARVFVEFDPGATGTVHRSLARGGNINLNEKTLKEHWGSRNLEVQIEWTRQGFWEGPETALTLTSFATAANTTVTVGNKSDSDAGNYVAIASTDIVLGDLPAPMKLTVTNTVPTSDAYGKFWEMYVFHNVDSSPSVFNPWIEAESSSDATSTTDVYSSNYAYHNLSWATTADTKLLLWVITNTQVDAAAGGRFAVFMIPSQSGLPSSEIKYWSVKLLDQSQSGYELITQKAQDGTVSYQPWYIDTIRLLPTLQAATTFAPVYLELWGYCPTTDTHTRSLDAIFLAPVSADSGWIKIVHTSLGGSNGGIAYNEKIVVNEYDDLVYHEASNKKQPTLAMYGGPILLVPNKAQRLYFLFTVPTAYVRFQTASVSISYRPRYRTL